MNSHRTPKTSLSKAGAGSIVIPNYTTALYIIKNHYYDSLRYTVNVAGAKTNPTLEEALG